MEKMLRIKCLCDIKATRCTRDTHEVKVQAERGPLCVARGRDNPENWLVYHTATGYAYPRDFDSKAEAVEAMGKLLKAAGAKWWSQTDVTKMSSDKKVGRRLMALYPARFSSLA